MTIKVFPQNAVELEWSHYTQIILPKNIVSKVLSYAKTEQQYAKKEK